MIVNFGGVMMVVSNEKETVKLPMDALTAREFHEQIKTKLLDKDVLDDAAIKKIKELYSLGNMTVKVANLSCDEAHSHDYKCRNYYNNHAGVVERLLEEIKSYRVSFDKIQNLANYEL
jgi:hypothetical protein